jgi:Uncharacterized protein conserved in bacteria (DUF2188)
MYEERHVVPNPHGGWDVLRLGGGRPVSHHRTPRDAVQRARAALMREGGELVIHDHDGHQQAKVKYSPTSPSRRFG